MQGRIKYTWNDLSPAGATLESDLIFSSLRNQTQSTDYPESQIGLRADELGYYPEVAFNFQDSLFALYQTRNYFEGRQSELGIETLIVPELDNVNFTIIEATPGQIKIDWLLQGSNYAPTDQLYARIQNPSLLSGRKRWAFGNLGQRANLTALIDGSLGTFGTVGQTLLIDLGWMSLDGKYSRTLPFEITIQDKFVWIQGDGSGWVQGDGFKWLYE